MFLVTLFTIAKLWTQPKCPLAEGVMYMYIMEYYSAIKKNEILLFTKLWMELKSIMLSEIIQSEKEKYIISLM